MMEYLLLLLLALPPSLLTISHARHLEDRRVLDLGVIFSWIVFIYAWLPILGLILAQHGYGVLQDKRVININPTPDEIVYVGMCYLAFLTGFAFIYGWQRDITTKSSEFINANWLQVFIVIVCAVLVLLANFAIRFLYDIDEAANYSDSYTQFRKFPLLIQQLTGVLSQIKFSVILAAMVFIIAWKPYLHRYVAIIVLGMLLSALLSGGSRHFGFLLAFAYVICFSIYVKRIKVAHLMIMVGTGLVLFTTGGILRDGEGGYGGGLLTLLQGGEFFSLFINSVDLLRQIPETVNSYAPWQLFWVDLLRFIPQQLFWGGKLDPAVWYASTYYPAYYKIGGGLAFGSIAESIIGFGFVEALVRGLLLALTYVFVRNHCISGRITPCKAFIYIWFVVMSYQAIRNTTFSIFSMFVFQVLPILIFVSVGHRAIVKSFKMNCNQSCTIMNNQS